MLLSKFASLCVDILAWLDFITIPCSFYWPSVYRPSRTILFFFHILLPNASRQFFLTIVINGMRCLLSKIASSAWISWLDFITIPCSFFIGRHRPSRTCFFPTYYPTPVAIFFFLTIVIIINGMPCLLTSAGGSLTLHPNLI